jgi:hypothetical protein
MLQLRLYLKGDLIEKFENQNGQKPYCFKRSPLALKISAQWPALRLSRIPRCHQARATKPLNDLLVPRLCAVYVVTDWKMEVIPHLTWRVRVCIDQVLNCTGGSTQTATCWLKDEIDIDPTCADHVISIRADASAFCTLDWELRVEATKDP